MFHSHQHPSQCTPCPHRPTASLRASVSSSRDEIFGIHQSPGVEELWATSRAEGWLLVDVGDASTEFFGGLPGHLGAEGISEQPELTKKLCLSMFNDVACVLHFLLVKVKDGETH